MLVVVVDLVGKKGSDDNKNNSSLLIPFQQQVISRRWEGYGCEASVLRCLSAFFIVASLTDLISRGRIIRAELLRPTLHGMRQGRKGLGKRGIDLFVAVKIGSRNWQEKEYIYM